MQPHGLNTDPDPGAADAAGTLTAVARRVLAGIVTVLVAAACGSTAGGAGGPATTRRAPEITTPLSPPTTIRALNVVATAIVPRVAVYDIAGQGDPAHTLDNPAPPYGTPLVFLVRDQQPDWLQVLLPVRPNGSTGWIRRTDVELASHDFRMLVDLGAHRLMVYQGDSIFATEPIAVGTQDTPTPGGLYYTKELLQPSDDSGRLIPDGPYGPYAYGLSGYSDVLYNFAGGDGVIGIHGTNEPASLGHDVSHGCIRLSNEAITKLATTLPIGVPVEITA